MDTVKAQAEKEALLASALDDDEKAELNVLLRKLMLAFERRDEGVAAAARAS
jgi:hypothetical protein